MIRRLLSLPGVRLLVEAVRDSYRRKLAAGLFVVLLVSAVAAVGLYVQVGVLLSENVEQSMTAAANSEASELTEWTGQNRLVARLLSEHPVYGSGEPAAVRSYLQTQRVERTEAEIVNTYVIDRRNLTVETSARRELEGTAVEDLPWEQRFAFQRFTDVRITRPYEDGTGETVLGFLTPIRAMPGHLLVVTIDSTGLFDRFEHPVDGGYTRVVDSNGTVVLADNRSAMLRQYRDERLRAPEVVAGLRGDAGFSDPVNYGRSNPDRTVAAYAPVEGTDWVVIEHAPADEAYAITGQVRTWIGLVGVVALFGLLSVVVVLGADVTRSLSRLTARAERIQAGEYDVDFDTDRPDEFGDLNRTLASTRDTLRERFEKLRETERALRRSNVRLEERSSMVTVLNRILRHNVRNDVNIIAGRTQSVAEDVDDERLREELDTVRRTALKLSDISDRTQRIKQLLVDRGAETTSLRLADALEAPLEEVRAEAPESTIRVDVPADVVVGASETLPLAIADVVEQIIVASDGPVSVDIDGTPTGTERDGQSVTLAVSDDGAGIPKMDVLAVERGEETPLNHAEGLALWCLKWTVDTTAGDLDVDPEGATVAVRLPVVDERAES
jgi:signal transduction histidine kinase